MFKKIAVVVVGKCEQTPASGLPHLLRGRTQICDFLCSWSASWKASYVLEIDTPHRTGKSPSAETVAAT